MSLPVFGTCLESPNYASNNLMYGPNIKLLTENFNGWMIIASYQNPMTNQILKNI